LEGIDENTDKNQIIIGTFEVWLEHFFGIEVNYEIREKIKRYERLVLKWLKK
jgi:hypothetical protein